MTIVPFTKMHGAGNDFVVIDHRRPFLPAGGEWMRRICDRRRGVGADGVLLLESAADADAAMRYFNADGGAADYCGNGARCLARFALDASLGHGETVTIRTPVGIQTARRLADGIEVRVGRVPKPGPAIELAAAGRTFVGRCVRPGVPHFVVAVDPGELAGVALATWGPPLRAHARFGAEGSNVDWVAKDGGDGWMIRTFERGVEGETLACGSGAIAAALAAAEDGGRSPVRVRTAGGDVLHVSFEASGDDWDVALAGPADVAFRGEWSQP